MSDKSLTDGVYSLVERLEARRMRMRAVPTLCFILSSVAVASSAWGYMVFSHQKSGLLDQYLILATVGILLSGIFIAIGSNKYCYMRTCERSLSELEDLEETIYREVFQAK